jgi:hypothetical protein
MLGYGPPRATDLDDADTERMADMSWFKTWFAYGLGRGAAKAILGEDERQAARPPIRPQTEEEIRADEKRYAEDEKRLDAEDAAAKRRGAG